MGNDDADIDAWAAEISSCSCVKNHVARALRTYLRCEDEIREMMRGLSDLAVEALAEADAAPPKLTDLAQAEVIYRYGLERARELNAAVYCFEHDCDMKDCPEGAHE